MKEELRGISGPLACLDRPSKTLLFLSNVEREVERVITWNLKPCDFNIGEVRTEGSKWDNSEES